MVTATEQIVYRISSVEYKGLDALAELAGGKLIEWHGGHAALVSVPESIAERFEEAMKECGILYEGRGSLADLP